jgi:hypothetical protein
LALHEDRNWCCRPGHSLPFKASKSSALQAMP